MEYIHYDSAQYLFDKSANGITIGVKLLLHLLVYVPLILTGYWLASLLLDLQAAALLWIGTTLFFAYLVFVLIYFLKGMLIVFWKTGNWLWLPLLIVCVIYTCVAPAYLVFPIVEKLLLHISREAGTICTWVICICFAAYIFFRYSFLTDASPLSAVLAYRAGRLFANHFV